MVNLFLPRFFFFSDNQDHLGAYRKRSTPIMA
jgi:hypothetical protein